MIKRTALLAMIFILSLSTSALAAETGSGMIEGRIINGTAGGNSVANQDITLKTHLNDTEIGSVTAKTDAQGRFLFGGLSTESGYRYQITLTFQQVEYYSEQLSFNKGETSKFVEVNIYDSTASDRAIKVAMAHTIIYVGQDNLLAKEYYLFVNEADQTYIGSKEAPTVGGKETLRFRLPKEATELQYTLGLMKCCIVGREGGFVDTMPVLPGDKEVAYSYKVSYNSGSYSYSLNVNYPIIRYDLLVQGEDIEVNCNRLRLEPPMDIRGSQFKHLSGSDFTPGDTIEVRLSSLPQTNNQAIISWVILALVVLIVGSGFVYLLKTRRFQPVRTGYDRSQIKQRLLAELALLDDDFENGKISEEVYRRERAATKAQLVELIGRSKEGVATDNGGT